MRHAMLGVGGVGGLVGAALARAGEDVVLLMRPEAAGAERWRLLEHSDLMTRSVQRRC